MDANGGIRRNTNLNHLGEGVSVAQPDWNVAEVAINMLDEVPEAFVAFGFMKSAWVEVNVEFEETVAVADANSPESINSWNLDLE
jgi:hypothetical protein